MSEQQSMKNIKLPVTIYFIKIWAYRQQNQSFSYQGEPRWTTSNWPASKSYAACGKKIEKFEISNLDAGQPEVVQ